MNEELNLLKDEPEEVIEMLEQLHSALIDNDMDNVQMVISDFDCLSDEQLDYGRKWAEEKELFTDEQYRTINDVSSLLNGYTFTE
jgi:hypothetical protein